MKQAKEHILEVLKELARIELNFSDIEIRAITRDKEVVNDLGLNSLTIFDFLYAIEKTFQIEMPERELMKVKTVGDIVDLIYNTQRAQ